MNKSEDLNEAIKYDLFNKPEWDYFYAYANKCIIKDISTAQFMHNMYILGYKEKILSYFISNLSFEKAKLLNMDIIFKLISKEYTLKKKYYNLRHPNMALN